MAPSQALPVLLALGGCSLARGGPVVQLDLFRAVEGDSVDVTVTESDTLASLGGVLKYLHTEIVEEARAAPDRRTRTNGVDSILGRRFKIKNPSFQDGERSLVDFGPYATFEEGQSIDASLDQVFRRSGDFVGSQVTRDSSYASSQEDPDFWFSASGFCPNLPWHQLPTAEGKTTQRCVDEQLCAPKGDIGTPAQQCLKDDQGQVLYGGLCAFGADLFNRVPQKDPAGIPGCTYTYGSAAIVSLDELVGITEQTCNGGRPCEDWFDFRWNCDDDSLRRRFNDQGEIVDARNMSSGASFCVEYDVHPSCRDCSSPACANLTGERELGLPFWSGRCDAYANRERVAALAHATGLEGALDQHETVAPDVLGLQLPCTSEGSSECMPEMKDGASTGGPYCSRAFSGVCYACRIPGALGSNATGPLCPYDILQTVDYASLASPNCTSSKAEDLCCLYTDTCEGEQDAANATLDASGLLLVGLSAWKARSTEPMLEYLQRVAQVSMNVKLKTENATVQRFAYQQWGIAPRVQTYAELQDQMWERLFPGRRRRHYRNSKVVLIIFICGMVFAVIVLMVVGIPAYMRRRKLRQSPPLLDGGSPSSPLAGREARQRVRRERARSTSQGGEQA